MRSGKTRDKVENEIKKSRFLLSNIESVFAKSKTMTQLQVTKGKYRS
jgi:hypothetical protein